MSNLCNDLLLPPVLLTTTQEINSPMLGLAVFSFLTSIITTLLEEDTLIILTTVAGIASHACLSCSVLVKSIVRYEKEDQEAELLVKNNEYLDAANTSQVFSIRHFPPLHTNTKIWTISVKILFVISLLIELTLLTSICGNMYYFLMLGSNTMVLVIMFVIILKYSVSVVTFLCIQTVLIFLTSIQIIVLIITNITVLIILTISIFLFMFVYIVYSINHSNLHYTTKSCF